MISELASRRSFGTIGVIFVLVAAACSGTSTEAPAPTSAGPETTLASTTTASTTTSVPTTTSAPTTTAAPTTTTAAATTTSIVDPEMLLGAWLDQSSSVLVTFAEDGNHYISFLRGEPFEFGPFTLDGNRLTMSSEDRSDPVCVGLGPGVFDIEIIRNGRWVSGTVVSDDCAERRGAWIGGLKRHEADE